MKLTQGESTLFSALVKHPDWLIDEMSRECEESLIYRLNRQVEGISLFTDTGKADVIGLIELGLIEPTDRLETPFNRLITYRVSKRALAEKRIWPVVTD